jgi:alkaline phosphatase
LFKGLFADEHLKYESDVFEDRRKNNSKSSQPTLEEMTIAAIDTLKNDDGFFLLVSIHSSGLTVE